MASRKTRIDDLLVARGVFYDRGQVQRAVIAGEVRLDGNPITSAALKVGEDADIQVKGHSRFVSRGGEKLEGAFRAFDMEAAGLSCLDCGASTGGFTDCLLQHGAAHVTAVDVGYGQFAWSLRCDERVTLLERTNLHAITRETEGAPFDLAVADMSFCSLSSYIECVAGLLAEGGEFLALVKPQFEVAREQVGEGGIVRDRALHEQVLERARYAFQMAGFGVIGVDFSPITGTTGNIEYLMLGKLGAPSADIDIARIVDTSHASLGK